MTLAAVSLELGDYAVIGGMLAGTAAITTTLMLANIRAVTRRVDVVEERVRKVEDEKVDKVDWLRESRSTRQKVDHVSEQLSGINSKLDAEFGMAAAINRLADGVTRMAEKHYG